MLFFFKKIVFDLILCGTIISQTLKIKVKKISHQREKKKVDKQVEGGKLTLKLFRFFFFSFACSIEKKETTFVYNVKQTNKNLMWKIIKIRMNE